MKPTKAGCKRENLIYEIELLRFYKESNPKAKITLEQLSKETEINHQVLCRWLNYKQSPRGISLIALRHFLKSKNLF